MHLAISGIHIGRDWLSSAPDNLYNETKTSKGISQKKYRKAKQGKKTLGLLLTSWVMYGVVVNLAVILAMSSGLMSTEREELRKQKY